MSTTHERLVKNALTYLRGDPILHRAAVTIPTFVADTLIGYLRALDGANRTDARLAAFAAMEIAANDRDLAKQRTKA